MIRVGQRGVKPRRALPGVSSRPPAGRPGAGPRPRRAAWRRPCPSPSSPPAWPWTWPWTSPPPRAWPWLVPWPWMAPAPVPARRPRSAGSPLRGCRRPRPAHVPVPVAPRFGEPPLGGCLVQQDRTRDGRVERVDPAMHRDPDQQVAAAPDGRPKALALAADDDRDRAAQVRLTGGQRRVTVGAHDAQAPTVEIGERARQVVHRGEPEMLDRPGRGLDGGGREGRLVPGRKHGAVGAGRLGGAQQRPDVLGVLQRDPARAPAAARPAPRPGPGCRPARPNGGAPRRARSPGDRRTRPRPSACRPRPRRPGCAGWWRGGRASPAPADAAAPRAAGGPPAGRRTPPRRGGDPRRAPPPLRERSRDRAVRPGGA